MKSRRKGKAGLPMSQWDRSLKRPSFPSGAQPPEILVRNICQSESLVPIGTVRKNTIYGLYGKVQTLPSAAQSVPVASREEVTVGPAEIYTVVQGTTPKRYAIQITEVRKQNGQAVKGIRFQVTDSALLNQTGGIIQGMSGSPILQNGKLIGAVTHMVTSQPDSGYGIYIDWMLEEARHD